MSGWAQRDAEEKEDAYYEDERSREQRQLKGEEALKVLREVQAWLKDERMGTWPYMEGTGFYEDKNRILERVEQVLKEA